MFRKELTEAQVEKIRKELIKISKTYPHVFSNDNPPRSKELQALIDDHDFGTIAGGDSWICEMWPAFRIMEQAMEIGFFVGRNPKKYKEARKKAHALYEKLESDQSVKWWNKKFGGNSMEGIKKRVQEALMKHLNDTAAMMKYPNTREFHKQAMELAMQEVLGEERSKYEVNVQGNDFTIYKVNV